MGDFISKKKEYRSNYASDIIEFVNLKKQLGFKYDTGEWYMLDIDRVAEYKKECTSGFTKEFADFYREPRLNESHQNRYSRVRFLLEFSSFLRDKGIDSYLPRKIKYKPHQFIPFIFSHEQITNVFKAADKLIFDDKSNSSSNLFCFPAIIRLLYSTGLRVGEAVALKEKDVDTKQNFIRVANSKNGKERILPMSKSLAMVCEQYRSYKNKLLLPQNRIEYFFVSPNGNKCSKQSVSFYFKKCFHSNLQSDSFNSGTPRVHDLRHSFAVHSLAQMAEAGVDLYASLPILSIYLGHNSFSSTEGYVRLTASIYPNLIDDIEELCFNIFPKLNNYETN